MSGGSGGRDPPHSAVEMVGGGGGVGGGGYGPLLVPVGEESGGVGEGGGGLGAWEAIQPERAMSYRAPTDRVRTIMTRRQGGSLFSDQSYHSDSLVYVRDVGYEWLPAQLSELIEDGAGVPREARVTVRLPPDWARRTMLEDDSLVRDLEDDLDPASTASFASASTRRGGGSVLVGGSTAFETVHEGEELDGDGDDGDNDDDNDSDRGAARSDAASYARSSSASAIGGAAADPSSSRRGQVRTVRLSDYPNAELPLQNVDGSGRLLGKSDMADLPSLHEAAVLYNLKDRHGRGVPYTRVGDIVVAMNPFRVSFFSPLFRAGFSFRSLVLVDQGGPRRRGFVGVPPALFGMREKEEGAGTARLTPTRGQIRIRRTVSPRTDG